MNVQSLLEKTKQINHSSNTMVEHWFFNYFAVERREKIQKQVNITHMLQTNLFGIPHRLLIEVKDGVFEVYRLTV
jgi:hypothetical protein